MTPIQMHAVMATIATKLNNSNSTLITIISKKPNNYIEVYLHDVPQSGPKLHEKIDELKEVCKTLQETIKDYEDKHRYNG